MKNGFNDVKDFDARRRIAVIAVALGFAVVLFVIVLTVVLLPDKLTRIEIETPPAKTHYIEKQSVNADGLSVLAYYGEKSVRVTDYVLDKTVLDLGDTEVTVSFTDGGVTKSAAFAVTVAPKSIVGLEIISAPTTTEYYEGATFDTTGLEVRAVYDNGESDAVSGWDYDIKRPLDVTDTNIVVSYGGKFVTVPITVRARRLQSISATRLPQKTVYVEGEYFDFLGLEITAEYDNGDTEVVRSWDYDKKSPLELSDESVGITYTLNGVTKSVAVEIAVNAAPVKTPEQELADNVIAAMPPVSELTEENIQSIDYVLSLLGGLSAMTSEQAELQERLQAKKQELEQGMPPVTEREYMVTYTVADGLVFSDVDFGGNPTKYKAGDGCVELADAVSVVAEEQGYAFKCWTVDGAPVTALENLTADITVYARFELTPTVDVIFKDYRNDSVLLTLTDVLRTDAYDFEDNNVSSIIYSQNGRLPVAYYAERGTRVNAADLSRNKTVTVYAVTAVARELHLPQGDGATVGWTYDFAADSVSERTVSAPNVGTVFVAPVGAEITVTSTHANIDDIFVDGVSKGSKLNNSIVQAVFELPNGEHAASVTFKTVLSDMTTLSFFGYNSHSVVYPAGWNGYIADVDLDNLAFVFDEANEDYLVFYTIDGAEYYFGDLAGYLFDGDTRISVDRVRNSFSFAVVYANGTERFDGLKGKRTLREVLNAIDESALETLNAALRGTLYLDETRSESVSEEDVLDMILRRDITVYSDWEKPTPLPPEPPVFDAVDYGDRDFVGEWSATFMNEGDILTVELALTADGAYSYAAYSNGAVSVSAFGVYRIENGTAVIKTAASDLPELSVEDISVNVAFAVDGMLVASFVDLRDGVKTVFDCTLTCGPVKPVNYTAEEFVGISERDGITFDLRGNGTAVIAYGDTSTEVVYRVVDKKLFIFDNGALGTGIIEGFFGG